MRFLKLDPCVKKRLNGGQILILCNFFVFFKMKFKAILKRINLGVGGGGGGLYGQHSNR